MDDGTIFSLGTISARVQTSIKDSATSFKQDPDAEHKENPEMIPGPRSATRALVLHVGPDRSCADQPDQGLVYIILRSDHALRAPVAPDCRHQVLCELGHAVRLAFGLSVSLDHIVGVVLVCSQPKVLRVHA